MLKITHLLIFALLLTLSACQNSPTPQTLATNVDPNTEAVTLIPQTVAPTSVVKETEAAYPVPYPEYSPENAEPLPEAAYPVPYPGPQAQSVYPGPYPESSANSLAQQPGEVQPYPFKTSSPGSVTLHGILLVTDPMQSRPQDNDAIFLVPLVGEEIMSIPPFIVGEAPQAEVNEVTGEFAFTNVKPGRYAVVVLTVGEAQIPARFYDKDGFVIITVKDSDLGQTIELEYIFI